MQTEPTLRNLQECAIAAATAAGNHALRKGSGRKVVAHRFKHDVKLKLDSECQARAQAVIAGRFPDHAILGEESHGPSREAGSSTYQWIIDPIDGTVNYFHGLPWWCCSIAVRLGRTMLAGAVYSPPQDLLYTATAASAATRNGKRIHPSSVASLDQAIVMTGLDKDSVGKRPPLQTFKRMALNTQKARVMGSAALDICLVADGGSDGYFEAGIFIWDVAAAGLIVDRAGGRSEIITDLRDNRLSFLATNGLIHRQLKRLL